MLTLPKFRILRNTLIEIVNFVDHIPVVYVTKRDSEIFIVTVAYIAIRVYCFIRSFTVLVKLLYIVLSFYISTTHSK